MTETKPIQTALLSYGMSGEVFHAPLLAAHSGFKLAKIWQRKSASSQARYPVVEIVKSFEEILADKSIELVVVNTPNETHFEYSRQALMAGKHVVVEKPYTNSVEEGIRLIDLAKKQNVMLSVFQNRRWDGGFMTVREIIQSNVLGKIVELEMHYDRYRNYIAANTWKEEPSVGSGILYNLGSHMLDQVIQLFGMPNSINAKIGIQRPEGKVPDFYDLRLDFDDLNVIVKSSYLVREAGPQYILHGINGSFLKYGLDPQEEALKEGKIPKGINWGKEPESFWGKLNTQLGALHYEGKVETLAGNYLSYYQNVYEVIREHKDLVVKPEQALQVIQLIEAAIKSNEERRSIDLV
ncbi:MAG TPA: Gfo/Idh/MocA family oxidoreductase [Chryseolinea sp.]|nr:Gfo/Idh/MocA family oxidoreductase [Chryseolinea sp.]HPM32534.1 Gfo/Idh/MocA family oxidoreductase [Chryseolinea sp.]